MIEIRRLNRLLELVVIGGDMLVMSAIFVSVFLFWENQQGETTDGLFLIKIVALLNICYLAGNLSRRVNITRRGTRADQTIRAVFFRVIRFALLSLSVLLLTGIFLFPSRYFIAFFALLVVCLIIYRISCRRYIIHYYHRHKKKKCAVFVGSASYMNDLYHEMTDSPFSDYQVIGYFEERSPGSIDSACPYLGTPDNVIAYLTAHPEVEQLYCSLPLEPDGEALALAAYCESHLLHFYSVPNVRNYLHHRLSLTLIGNVPILNLHRNPLGLPENRALKRAFDILFSLTFLCTLFPFIFVLVGIIIKRSSPGPIFFKQQRNGLDNKVFWCYKFRSMRVNKEADKQQATAADPRTTRFGEFIRHTNIDELPQFINVLLGDMSIVGPRPHMIKHTELYAQLINKYMVRHFIKPGITGWAQISGFRGETRELAQMEGRINADIWYMEHWTFMFDLYIVYRTAKNFFHNDRLAY
ncbi:MAG: undecaprenyl-phosphate glucose phosphotransferase [Bacteroides sp.]